MKQETSTKHLHVRAVIAFVSAVLAASLVVAPMAMASAQGAMPADVSTSADASTNDAAKIDLKSASVSITETPMYTGKELTPAPKVSIGGKTLVKDKDYTVGYTNCVNAGTAIVTITGIGDYTGSTQTTFVIFKASMGSASVTFFGPYAHTGKPVEPNPRVVVNGNVLVKGDDYTLTYADNTKVGIATVVITGIGNYNGSTVANFSIAAQGVDASYQGNLSGTTNTMHRLYNPNSGEHFYTASDAERQSLVKSGWNYEGVAWVAPKESKTPVYRLYSGTDHHYTTSLAEKQSLVKAGWKDEGIGWYSDDQKRVGLHRVFNPNVNPSAPTNNSGSHHYTISTGEKDSLVKAGWNYENIGWYAVSAK